MYPPMESWRTLRTGPHPLTKNAFRSLPLYRGFFLSDTSNRQLQAIYEITYGVLHYDYQKSR